MSINVRFAPSPTGYLHIGGARTVYLTTYLQNIIREISLLRIEDNDKARPHKKL